MDANVNRETGTSTAAAKRSDFVWAIRVAKISKGVLDGEWSHATFAKGALFGLDDDEDKGEISSSRRSQGKDSKTLARSA